MPESRFELQHAGSPSEEAALEEEGVNEKGSRGRSVGAGGVGRQEIAGSSTKRVAGWPWCCRAGAGSKCNAILIRTRSSAW